jgi:hypothetical protein
MLVAVALLVLSAPARAGVEFQLGNHPQSNEENILFGAKETGSSITGQTNQSKLNVNFSSTSDTLVQNSSGQADVGAQDGSVNNIKITVPNGSFTDLIINPFKGEGSATVDVVLNDGTGSFTYDLGKGNNFLTITTKDGETITSVTINADKGFTDLKQPRISGASVVPEPSTMALALVGVAGLGLGGLRRFRRRPPLAIA